MKSIEIKAHASKLLLQGDAPLFVGGFTEGAEWANEQNAAEIARLEAEKAELLEGLCGIARLFDSALGENKTSGAISVLLEKYRN